MKTKPGDRKRWRLCQKSKSDSDIYCLKLDTGT